VSSVRRTIKNFFSLLIAHIISQAILFLVVVYLARTLGAANFGELTFSQAVVLYFTLIANLGLTTLGIREVARNKDRIGDYVGNILSLRLVLALFSFFLLLAFVSSIHKTTQVKYLITFFGLSLFSSALWLGWLFQGVEKMGFIAFSRILDSSFYGMLVFLLIKNSQQILVIPFLWVGGNCLATLFLIYIFLKRFGKPRLRFDFSFWKNMLRRALPMGAAFIMIQIYYNFDTVMLGFMKSDEIVGWYNAAYKIILFIWAFIPIFVNAIFPLMSRYYKESKEKLQILISSATKLMSSIALPLGIGGTILARPIMSFLYGEEYIKGVIAFQILIWTVAIISIRCSYEQSFLACDREKRYLLGVIIGAATNIILNLILIPYFDLKGAAIATVISEFVFSLYMFSYFKIVSRVKMVKYLLKPFLAAAFMGFFVYYFRGLNLFFSLLMGIAVYLIAILLLKGITREELRELKVQIIGKT